MFNVYLFYLGTLSEYERTLFFDAIKIMKNTSYAVGSKTEMYGKAYRTYDYLAFKHAIAAVHSCIDQGHMPSNVITFHRALLLEFELSMLAIVNKLNEQQGGSEPLKGLEALPYWNWFIDLDSGRNRYGYEVAKNSNIQLDPGSSLNKHNRLKREIYESSLWEYWGSAYGDPDNYFAIHDPIFDTFVTTHDSTIKLNGNDDTENNSNDNQKDIYDKYRSTIFLLGERGLKLGNSFGIWRSPYDENPSPKLSRNPGWVFNSIIEFGEDNIGLIEKDARDCVLDDLATNYLEFGGCTSGNGVGDKQIYFGPHFSPHTAMGTFHDSKYTNLPYILPIFVSLFCFLVYIFILIKAAIVLLYNSFHDATAVTANTIETAAKDSDRFSKMLSRVAMFFFDLINGSFFICSN